MSLAYKKRTTQIAKEMGSVRPQMVIEADFSENDMRQCKDVIHVERLWLERLGAPKWLLDIMYKANKYTVYNKTHAFKGKVRYQLPSGSTSTTFRNSVWNMTIFYSWARRINAEGVAYFLGDDMVASISKSRCYSTKQGRRYARRLYDMQAKRARMSAKVKVHSHLVSAEFLSKVFIPSSEQFHLLPKFGRVFARFNVRHTFNQQITDEEYMAGKCLSIAWEYRHLTDIVEILYERFISTGVEAKRVSRESLSWDVRQHLASDTVKELLTEIGTSDGISYDDMCAFTYERYGEPYSDLLEIVRDVVLGDEDISLERYSPYAAADYW